MHESIDIVKPEVIGCYKHEFGVKGDCSVCSELNKRRKTAFVDAINAVSYKVVYENWSKRLKSILPDMSKVKEKQRRVTYQHYIDKCMEELTKEFYPFVQTKGPWKASWKRALKELSVKLEDTYIPEGVNKVLEKKEMLWY